MQLTGATWKIVLALVVLAALGAGIWAWYAKTALPSRDTIAYDNRLTEAYDKALEAERQIEANPAEVKQYLIAGLQWKTIGDITNQAVWYERAREVYERGISATGRTNTLLMANAAIMNELLGDYQASRELYEEALRVSPGDSAYYLALARVLESRIKASHDEIIAVYNEGAQRVVGPAEIVSGRAEYLVRARRFDEARADFKLLLGGGVLTQEQYDKKLQMISQAEAQSQ